MHPLIYPVTEKSTLKCFNPKIIFSAIVLPNYFFSYCFTLFSYCYTQNYDKPIYNLKKTTSKTKIKLNSKINSSSDLFIHEL